MQHLRFQITGIGAEQLFSVGETANLLGHNPQWIYRNIHRGQLDSQLIAGRHVIRGEDIVAYLDQRISYGPVYLAGGHGETSCK